MGEYSRVRSLQTAYDGRCKVYLAIGKARGDWEKWDVNVKSGCIHICIQQTFIATLPNTTLDISLEIYNCLQFWRTWLELAAKRRRRSISYTSLPMHNSLRISLPKHNSHGNYLLAGRVEEHACEHAFEHVSMHIFDQMSDFTRCCIVKRIFIFIGRMSS